MRPIIEGLFFIVKFWNKFWVCIPHRKILTTSLTAAEVLPVLEVVVCGTEDGC